MITINTLIIGLRRCRYLSAFSTGASFKEFKVPKVGPFAGILASVVGRVFIRVGIGLGAGPQTDPPHDSPAKDET